MIDQSYSTFVRSQIRPYKNPKHDAGTYHTGWGGIRTFDQIMQDCTPLAATLVRKHGISSQDFPDALQRGFMVLFERLVKNPDLLVDDDKMLAAKIVDANCGNNYWKRHERHVSLDNLVSMGIDDNPDEWMLTGLESERTEVWAAWATATDLRLDIERIMQHLANEYLSRATRVTAIGCAVLPHDSS